MSLEPTGTSRVRILGRRSTNTQVAQYIKAALADPNQTKSKLANTLGTSRPTVDKYLALADAMRIEVEASKETKNSKMEETQPEFLRNPDVEVWIEFMDRRTRFEGKSTFLLNMYQVCKTLKCPPGYFLMGNTPLEVLEHGRKLLAAFMAEFKAGTALVRYGKKAGEQNMEQVAYRFSKAVRDFMKAHGYQYPTREGGVMSQSVAAFHGKYPDIRISEEMHKTIQRELADEFGQDSDEWLIYSFGLESMAREQAILTATTQYEMVTLKGRPVMIMRVYESKTKHYKNGIWVKHLYDTDLHAQIKQRAKQSDKLFNLTAKRVTEIAQVFKAKYRQHKLTTQGQEKPGNPESSYCLKKPFHVLRHYGAQRMLRATNWNVTYVALRGWKTTQELIDSYGEMPPEMELEAMGNVAF